MNTHPSSVAGLRVPAFLRRVCVFAATLLAFSSSARAAASAMDEFGLCIRPHIETDSDAYCDRIIASGVKWVRLGRDWGALETSKGVYSATALAKMDSIVNRLHAGGVNMVWILGFTAPWASTQPSLPWAESSRYRPANWIDWEDHVAFVVNRYKTKISHWEIWNEPDHIGFWKSSVADYATLLQKAHAKVKALAPTHTVLLGGLATTNGSSDSYGLGTFFDQLLALGAASHFDVVNYHAYGTFAKQIDRHAGMRAVIDQHGIQSKPIWITETGNTTIGDPAREAMKADMVNQISLGNLRFGDIDRSFWYCLTNPVISPPNPSEENFGLTTPTHTPLNAWWHYQALEGAETDFARQAAYPSLTSLAHTLYYYPATSGDGSYVTASGNDRVIPPTRYMYLRLNDGWIHDSNRGVDLTVHVDITYLDSGTSNFSLEYDSESSAYQSIPIARTNTGLWKTATLTLTNAKFANRQNNASDLRLYAGGSGTTTNLTIRKVAIRKAYNPAIVTLQTTPTYKLIEYVIASSGNAYNPVATQGGLECRSITADNQWFFFKVSDALIRAGDTNVSVEIMFWDAGTDKISLQYGAIGNAAKNVNIMKTATNTWRTVTLNVTDAHFVNQQSYFADFRISNGYDGSAEYVRRVKVTVNN